MLSCLVRVDCGDFRPEGTMENRSVLPAPGIKQSKKHVPQGRVKFSHKLYCPKYDPIFPPPAESVASLPQGVQIPIRAPT